jgi:hypothetical protein
MAVVYGGAATGVGTGCRVCRRFHALLDRRSKLEPVLFLGVIMRFTFSKLAGALSTLPILLVCASGVARAQDVTVITASELAGSRAENTYQAIRQIRPELLRSRVSGSLMLFEVRHPSVALNNSLVGGVEALRSIPVDQVTRLEYLSAWEAGNRYGMTFQDGIMLVQTRDNLGDQLSMAR